jgi:amino acid adenylation domain-containing protein
MDGNRIPKLIDTLRPVLAELAGKDLSGIDPQTTFFEMGFDSLLLTQVATSLKKRFQIKITFRQLLEELTSLQAIARYIDGQMPADIVPANASGTGAANQGSPVTPALPAIRPVDSISSITPTTQPIGAAGVASGNSALERVINEQLTLMARQLQMLRGQPARILSPAGNVPPEVAKQISSPPGGNAHDHIAKEDLKRFGPFKGIEIGPKGGLTPRQEQSLAELTVRYNRRTAGSKAYAQKHRSYFCDPRAAGNFRQLWKEMVYPIVCARSKGGKIWDIDGNEYVDLTLGFGANYFGHSPEFVVEAVEAQLQKGFEIGPQSPLAGEAAQMLCEMTGMERATFCNTGSEAVMAAVRVVRTVTGRDKIVYFSGDYHGIFDEVLARAGLVGGQPGALPIAPGIPALHNIIVLEYDNPASLDVIRANAKEIAGVIVEPVQSRHPDLQPREFLRALRELTSEMDIALIFDEIVTGFRAALGGAQEYFGVRADLATYGKVVGGGMSIGVLAGTRRFMDALDGGMWSFGDESFPEVGVTFFAGTFVRHPLAIAATHATLQYLKNAGPELQKQTTEKTARFVRRLNDYFISVEVPIRLQTFSSVFYYDFHPDLKFAGLLFYHLRDRGVHVWEGRVGQICTAHTEEDLNFVFEAFKSSVEELQAGGLIPVRAATAETVPVNSLTSSSAAGAPLTEAQREVWISCQMGDDAHCAYNESCSLHLQGVVELEALQKALQHVIQRHDAFRCRFSLMGDRQFFDSETHLEMPLQDLSNLANEELTQQIQKIIAGDMATPFDLANGSMFRAQLLKLGRERFQFIFTTHHIVCDGWSFGVFFQELAQFYSAIVASKPCDISPAMPFAEFIRWSHEETQLAESSKAEKFWIQKFEDTEVPTLDLPADRPRPNLKTYNGSLAIHRCAPQVVKDLKSASAQLGNTVFATLFAAFNALIYRLSGQSDVIVGIPAAGQTMIESDDLIGHCLNLLPVRSRVTGKMAFDEFAGRVKGEVLDAYEHQNYTYGTLIQKLKLPRDASRLPLLSVMFNIDKRGMDQLKFADLKATVSTNPKQFVNFDLFVNLVQGEHELDVECEFNTDLFDRATMQRWLGHFETVVRAVAANPKLPIEDLPLNNPAEMNCLLVGWNQTERVYPRELTIHALFEEQVRRFPDKIAVQCGVHSMTYHELDNAADALAAQLWRSGVQVGSLVGIYLDRSVEMVVGVMGILKSGAAYVPMDPAFPAPRLAGMIEDAKMRVIVTLSNLVLTLPAHKSETICLDAIQKIDPVRPGSVPVRGENLAYVIFTSGSTGRPKGVQIQHRSVVNFLNSMRREPGIRPEDVLLSVTTLSFDIAGLELFLPLTSGASLVVARRETMADGNSLRQELETKGITLMQATPVTWTMLVEAGWPGKSDLKILCGGEALPQELARQLIPRCASLWNMYGPTETTIWSTLRQIKEANEPVNIGRPIDNTQIYIVDERLQPTPMGIPGELLIGGDGLALGYLHQPELTAEKFIRNPFDAGAGSRLYRTGDLARYLPDGNVDLIGRNDQQVKLRGFRIELGETESALRTHPLVKDCVVVLREDSPGRKLLVAFVSLGTNGAGETNLEQAAIPGTMPEVLKELAQAKLPEYMMPSTIVVLEALPRTPNGKIDRKALPAPLMGLVTDRKEFIAPRNEKERALADIWMQVLGLDKVSVMDNFFELGGDSLLSFRIANRASQYGLPLTPRMFFQHKTIAGLVKVAVEANGEAGKTTEPAIIRVSRNAHRSKLPEMN